MDGAAAYERAKRVFLEVVEAAPDERDLALERLCAGDGELRNAVRRLLDAHAAGRGVLDRQPAPDWIPRRHASPRGPDEPTSDAPPSTDPAPYDDDQLHPGDRLGRYTILARLGEGGMGLVYEARQDGTDRLVALKVIRPERMSASGRRRFDAE